MDKIEQARLEQLERCIPNVWEHKRVLYIGAYSERTHFFDALKANKCIVDVVEIEQENWAWLNKNHAEWLDLIMRIDIVDLLCVPLNPHDRPYDMILWSHGVEVLTKEEGLDILRNHIEKWVAPGGIIINMTPNRFAGGTGNTCAWEEKEFQELGYQTNALGKLDERNSNILAYKHIGAKNVD